MPETLHIWIFSKRSFQFSFSSSRSYILYIQISIFTISHTYRFWEEKILKIKWNIPKDTEQNSNKETLYVYMNRQSLAMTKVTDDENTQ